MRLPRVAFFCFLASTALLSCTKEQPTADNTPPIPKWKKVAPFTADGRVRPVTFAINGKGYVGLGTSANDTADFIYHSDLWEFNPADDTWTKKADFPGIQRAASTSFAIGSKGYVANGQCDCNDFWEYDPATDKWSKKADFPMRGILYTSAFTLNNKAYVGTGVKDGVLQRGIYEYDPAQDRWTQKGDFPGEAMDAGVGFAILDKGYLATGNQKIGVSKALWEYDAATDVWTQKADFPYETYLSVGFCLNNKGYIGLGFAGAEIWEYDPAIDTWKKAPDFEGGNRTGAMSMVIGDKAYVGQGAVGSGNYPNDMWALTNK